MATPKPFIYVVLFLQIFILSSDAIRRGHRQKTEALTFFRAKSLTAAHSVHILKIIGQMVSEMYRST